MSVPVSRSIWQTRPALPGPILRNGVEFRFTIEYHLNSFFGCCWHANVKKRSELLTPRVAAWMKLEASCNIVFSSNDCKLTDHLILNVQITMEDQCIQGQPETDWGHDQVLLLSLLPLAGAAIRLRIKLAIYHIMISSNARKLTDHLILNVRITMEVQFTQDQPETDWCWSVWNHRLWQTRG